MTRDQIIKIASLCGVSSECTYTANEGEAECVSAFVFGVDTIEQAKDLFESFGEDNCMIVFRTAVFPEMINVNLDVSGWNIPAE